MASRARCAAAVVMVCLFVLAGVGAGSAYAHPFGDPQTVRITADGAHVTTIWSAPADDVVLLGGVLGALPGRREIVFDADPGGVPEPVSSSDAELIASSPDVHAYIEERLVVRQDGQPCQPEVSLQDLAGEGAQVVFTCPRRVTTVDIEITLLTDLHPGYRTVALSQGASEPGRTLYTAQSTVHSWTFGTSKRSEVYWSGRELEQHLTRAFDSGVVVPVALLVATVVGAFHGLAPGHGKTLTAAYLVGAGARRRQAVGLAVLVAGMHTFSVLTLGLLWWIFADSGAISVSAATRWAQLVAAVAVLAVGVVITKRRWRQRHVPHHHHHHAATDTPPWSRTGLIGIASVGGLVPSPSAFLVLISGLLTGRAGLAIGMVAMFGFGLAITILAAGLLTLVGRDRLLDRGFGRFRWNRALAYAPLTAAGAVVVGGFALGVMAVMQLLSS
jgi:ABC-type nickel/cobalt efflux system permease component RcnA